MSSLSAEDSDALSAVLPNGALYDSPFSYYADIATIFAKVFETYHEVHFNQLALSVAPADVDTSQLWISVIRGSLELTQYDDAYVALVAMPYPSLSVLSALCVVLLLTRFLTVRKTRSECSLIACARRTQSKD